VAKNKLETQSLFFFVAEGHRLTFLKIKSVLRWLRFHCLWTTPPVLTGYSSAGPVAPVRFQLQQCHGSPQRRSSSSPSHCPSAAPADSGGVCRRCGQQHTRCLPCGNCPGSETHCGEWGYLFCRIINHLEFDEIGRHWCGISWPRTLPLKGRRGRRRRSLVTSFCASVNNKC